MIDSEKLFLKADKEWDKGNLKVAFELFLESAKKGNECSQNNVGIFYESGLGVRKNSQKALYWYKRAFRNGLETAVKNIANYYFKQGNQARAKAWYKKAIETGDGDASLEMAKVYLSAKQNKHNINCAKKYLRMALKNVPMEGITSDGYEEAEKLLAKIMRDK